MWIPTFVDLNVSEGHACSRVESLKWDALAISSSSSSSKKGKGSAYSITERKVPELIPVLGSQPAGDVSHKPGGRLPLFPPGLQLPPQPLRKLLLILLLDEQRHNVCEQFA